MGATGFSPPQPSGVHQRGARQGRGGFEMVQLAILWYDSGMKAVAKVAVSIPSDTLRLLERARARLRKTRSAVVTEAIERWLAVEELTERDKRYVEGYLRRPERSDESSVVASSVVQEWEPWE
jgi:hypothetical protein